MNKSRRNTWNNLIYSYFLSSKNFELHFLATHNIWILVPGPGYKSDPDSTKNIRIQNSGIQKCGVEMSGLLLQISIQGNISLQSKTSLDLTIWAILACKGRLTKPGIYATAVTSIVMQALEIRPGLRLKKKQVFLQRDRFWLSNVCINYFLTLRFI